MEKLRIDAQQMFRAVTATGFKLLAFNLDLRTGEIISRTMTPDEVKAEAAGPSVKPLPKMGGELTRKTDFIAPSNKPLFDDAPKPAASKPKLFDDDGPKKSGFDGDFWKRDDKKKPALFGEDFKRENATKKLASLFGEAPKSAQQNKAPKGPAAPMPVSGSGGEPNATDDPYYPRIPAADEAGMLEWMTTFSKQCGDPQIREELLKALAGAKPQSAFDRVLRNHIRMAQQWETFLRKTALACAEIWLQSLGVTWEWVE